MFESFGLFYFFLILGDQLIAGLLEVGVLGFEVGYVFAG